MNNRLKVAATSRTRASGSSLPGVALVALALVAGSVGAAGKVLSGKQVVDAVCGNCHATGANGAPMIGDVAAWKSRTSQGLTSLTQHALLGLRKMPSHGGNPGLSDIDIQRAITYMVNQSGGLWFEPVAKGSELQERSGEQIVGTQCVKCHETGIDGAPRIGDLAAWAPRLSRGMDVLIRSAIHGHGAMPPRGGLANLTDSEMRIATLYMFNKGVVQAAESAPPKLAPMDRNHRKIEGMDVYLGIMSAESIKARHTMGGMEQGMHGGIPRGKGYYHVNISLLDSSTGQEIKDAKVELRIDDPVMGAQKKELELVSFNSATSYGNYFRMPDKYGYRITAQIYRTGQPGAAQARFDFRPE